MGLGVMLMLAKKIWVLFSYLLFFVIIVLFIKEMAIEKGILYSITLMILSIIIIIINTNHSRKFLFKSSLINEIIKFSLTVIVTLIWSYSLYSISNVISTVLAMTLFIIPLYKQLLQIIKQV